MSEYQTIVADPPWKYGSQRGAVARGHARSHYPVMDLADIEALPVSDLAARDAHLWLWGVNQLFDECYRLARSWGFKPITALTWCKLRPGTGYYLRNNTEHCLLATRGKPMPPEDVPISSWYIWPRAKHSQKPEAFYDLVERVSPDPRLELFARRNRMGWDTWGNEALNHVEVDA